MATWTHADAMGIWPRSQDALDRSLSGGWLAGDLNTRGAELRAMLFRTGFAASLLTLRGKPLPPTLSRVDLSDIPRSAYPSAAHCRAGRACLGWVEALAGDKRPLSDTIVTNGGDNFEAEGWPIVLVRVLGTAIWALATCYIAERYESTFARMGDHVANSIGMMRATATATQIVENHAAREREAGQSLPFSPQEQAVLDASIAATNTFANKPVTPPDSHPSLGSGVGSFGTGAVVALGFVGYYLLRGSKS